MDQPPGHDCGTRSVGKVILEVVHDPVPLPEGKGTNERRRLGEFGGDCVWDVDGLSQMANQALEEFLSRTAGGPFDHRAESEQAHRGVPSVVSPR